MSEKIAPVSEGETKVENDFNFLSLQPKIQALLDMSFPCNGGWNYIKAITPTYFVYASNGNIFKVAFTVSGEGDITLGERESVKEAFVAETYEGKATESVSLDLTQSSEKGYVWETTLISAGLTKTANVSLTPYGLHGKRGRFFYPEDVLARAAEGGLFENALLVLRSKAEHASYANGGGAMVRVNEETEKTGGVFQGTHYAKNAEGTGCVKGKLVLRKNKAGRAMREFLQGKAAESGKYGLSWTGDTKYVLENREANEPTLRVTEIVQVLSVDPVERGNAGGEIIRAAESFFTNPPTMSKILIQQKTRLIALAAEADVTGAADASAGSALAASLLDYAAQKVWDTMPAAKDVYDSVEDLKSLPEEKLVKLFDTYCANKKADPVMPAAEAKSAETISDPRVEAMQKQLVAMHLNAELGKSGLPVPTQEFIRKQFEGKAAETVDIDNTIRDAKTLQATMTQSPSRGTTIKFGQDEGDKVARGFDHLLFNSQDGRAAEAFKAEYGYDPRDSSNRMFRGINEAWRVAFGMDSVGMSIWTDDRGGRASEAITGDANTTLVADALHRRLISEWRSLIQYDAYRKVCSVLSVNDFKSYHGVQFGSHDAFASASGTTDYSEVAITTEEDQTISVSRYGGILTIGIEQLRNDDVNAVRRMIQNMARIGKRQIYEAAFDLFKNAWTTTYTSTGEYVISTAHGNTGGTDALTADNVIEGRNALMQMAELGSGKPMGIAPKYLLYQTPDTAAAFTVLTPAAGQSNNVGTLTQSYGLEGIEVPYWGTNYERWFLVCDPAEVESAAIAFLDGKEEPETQEETKFSGKDFTADAYRVRCKLAYGTAWMNYRGVYGSKLS